MRDSHPCERRLLRGRIATGVGEIFGMGMAVK